MASSMPETGIERVADETVGCGRAVARRASRCRPAPSPGTRRGRGSSRGTGWRTPGTKSSSASRPSSSCSRRRCAPSPAPSVARAVVLEVALARELHLAAAAQVLARVREGHALHEPRVATAVGERDQLRRPVLVLLGQEGDEVGRCLEVTVAGDDLVLAAHDGCSPCPVTPARSTTAPRRAPREVRRLPGLVRASTSRYGSALVGVGLAGQTRAHARRSRSC